MSVSTTPAMPGIHHITAICNDPQRNIDFYTGLLGLRLVKLTVNFDDPGTYHFYYGDGAGSPGTIMTFFPWIVSPQVTVKPRTGTGQVGTTAFLIPAESVQFWADRLKDAQVAYRGPAARFNEVVIAFNDPDGLPLELVARDGGRLPVAWDKAPVPAEHAIRGFAGATFNLAGYEQTARLLTGIMGFREAGSEGDRFRFQVGAGDDAAMIDLLVSPEGAPGRAGIGAVHHIAWRTPSREQLEQWRRVLIEAGFNVTTVRDRKYFQSIYFREPGGILFEIATDPPGFTVDEPPDRLGSSLQLPPWLEPQRAEIEAQLPRVRLP